MKETNSNDIDTLVAAVTADKPSNSEIEAAAERVREVLAKESSSSIVHQQQTMATDDSIAHNKQETNDQTQLNSLQQYIDAIPDYLANRLSPALTELFEVEARQSMDLRRALNDAKRSRQSETRAQSTAIKPRRFAWFYSAAAVLMLSIALMLISPNFPSFNQSQLAQVEDISGKLFHVENGQLQALSAGDWIDGTQTLRTASDTTAMLVLDDGSRIEVGPRAELQFMRRGHGNRIDVERGKIIVAASPQGSGTLDVMTEEFVVSVTGTIFEVGHGANGSRVSVIEGEVQVQQRGDSTSVVPGEQFATRLGKNQLGIENDIAWSRNADEYISMLQEVAALQRDIENVLETEPRYSKRLLNLAPENTVFFAAVPNAPEKIVEIYSVIRDRIQQSETMSKKLDGLELDDELEQLDGITNWLAEMGDTLGDETVAALKLVDGATGQHAVPLILSEVNAEAFRANFESRLASWREKLMEIKTSEGSEQSDKNAPDFDIVIIDDPAQALPNQLSIWLHEDLLIATIGVETIREIEKAIEDNSSNFMNSGLYTQLVKYYDEGAEFLGGVDLHTMLDLQKHSEEFDADEKSALALTGIANAEFLMVHHTQDSNEANFNVELIFDSERSGIMSWLAEPAPMGSLDFFSINTAFVSASIIKSPQLILEEIKRITGESLDTLSTESADSKLAVEISEDLLASFGGEMAFGLDGPALPTPSWKVVVEVNDEALLQETINRIIISVNNRHAESGAQLKIVPMEMGEHNAYQIELSLQPKSSDSDANSKINVAISYAYKDGYLIAAPNAAFLERAINQYNSGIGLLSSASFQALLARGGDFDFSALTFSRIDQLLTDLTKNLPKGLTREQHRDFRKIRGENREPSILTITGHPESIRLAHSGNFLPDISSIMSMQSLAGILLGNEELFKEDAENSEETEQSQ
jgi:hypothetical protein